MKEICDVVALANEENGKQINSNPDNTKDGIDGKDILNNGWSCFNVAVYPGSFLNKLNKPLL